MKQRAILNNISPDFARDGEVPGAYIERKINATVAYLSGYTKKSGTGGFVLGISGGVDSFVAGALCAKSCADTGKELHLLLLPNGVQVDYKDAQDSVASLQKIYPALTYDSISIEHGYAGAMEDLSVSPRYRADKVTLGNLQPRLRMMYQYALANGLLVVGTDHASEAVTGFYTKYGDGGTDINPLQELVKDDIYEIARLFGAPAAVLTKQPSAGLGITSDDESELGIKYKDICSYLKGNVINSDVREKLEDMYRRSMHKRAMPASMKDLYAAEQPTSFVVVDMIHAFIDGELACRQADTALENCIAVLNRNPGWQALYVADRHPQAHCSFKENGGTWEVHAVEGTESAAFPDMFYRDVVKTTNTPVERYNVFLKGQDAGTEQYSGYEAKNTQHGFLKDNLEKCVIIAGIATEFCVLETVQDLLKNGYDVTVLTDCLAYVDEAGYQSALEKMQHAGAKLRQGV